MSGHSKFANIKHKNGKNDAAKGKIFTIIGREIAVAVKEGGSDPANNSRLRDVIAKAKANNMPNDTIDRGIKKAAGDSNAVNYEYVSYEGYGPGGIAIIVDALTDNKNRTAANVRSAFTKGSNPQTTAGDYSNAFAQIEPYEFNTVCLDTEDTEIHLLLQSFLNRIFDAGSLAQAVVAEAHTVPLETRMQHAAAFNDEKMNYVLNAHVDEQGTEIDGYRTAARIAGMIGSVSAGSSLTHTVISGFSELKEKLTNTEMISAEKRGCIVLSYNKAKQVWIDNAINTLITPADNQDDGWKKIRRVKTRYELIRRINTMADDLVGKVDNDKNGRATVISQIQGVGDSMAEEGKLVACSVTESSAYQSDGDSAWFDIDIIDKDSMERIYLTFLFRFSTNEG